MFIIALFTVAKIWRQPKCPSTGEWIKKMWYIYITAIKMNKVLPSATTWMGLGDIMLSKISQTERDKHCMVSLTYAI